MDLRLTKPQHSPALLRGICVLTVALLGVSLACLSLYWTSPNHRQHQEIDLSISEWQSHSLYQAFSTVHFDYQFHSNATEVGGEYRWTREERQEVVERMEMGEGEEYNVSFFYAEGDLERVFPKVAEDPRIRFYVHAKPVCLEIHWKSDSQANFSSYELVRGLEPCAMTERGMAGGITIPYWKHESVPILCEHPMECVAKCMNFTGNWVGWDRRGSCYRFVVLERICVKVRPERVSSEEEEWVWDGGCFAGGRAAKYMGISPLLTANFSSFPLELRLSKDPVAAAYSLSTDSLRLSPSKVPFIQASYRTAGLYCLYFAVILIGAHWGVKRHFQQKEDSYREQIDVMASLPE